MGGQTMLYVSCGETMEILHLVLDSESGGLEQRGATRLPGAPPPGSKAPARPEGMARLRTTGAPLRASRNGQFLYAAPKAAPHGVLSFRIDSKSGDLEQIGEAPVPEGTVYIDTDRAGRFLIGAAYFSNCIWVSRIGMDGAIAAPPMQQAAGVTTAHSVLLHPAGRTLYAGATGLSSVQIFDFGEGAEVLSERRSGHIAVPEATPRHLAVHPGGRFLYCMNETSSVIDMFAISEDGRILTPLQTIDPRPLDQRDAPGIGADIVISRDGHFLYCCERKRGTIAVFAINQATGMMMPVQTAAAGSIPRSLALAPSGKFLATAAQGDGVVHIHAVSPRDGSLTHRTTFETGGAPVWVEFVELGGAA